MAAELAESLRKTEAMRVSLRVATNRAAAVKRKAEKMEAAAAGEAAAKRAATDAAAEQMAAAAEEASKQRAATVAAAVAAAAVSVDPPDWDFDAAADMQVDQDEGPFSAPPPNIEVNIEADIEEFLETVEQAKLSNNNNTNTETQHS